MTARMQAVLVVLSKAAGPLTANEVALACGFEAGDAGRARDGRVMAPAVHVSSALRALERGGFVVWCRRPDRRSGSAFEITKLGRQEIR